MIAAVLETVLSEQEWIELPGVKVVDLRKRDKPSAGASEAVERLRRALEKGVAAHPDPRRANFYEASIDGFRYYFHVAPRRPATVFLLGRWRE